MPNIPAGTQVKDLSTVAARIAAAWDALNGRAFGPGIPIAPASDTQEQTEGPRQYQYGVGWNTRYQPRGETSELLPFQQLRNLARMYDIAALAIATRIEELQGVKFSIVAKSYKACVMRLNPFGSIPTSSTTLPAGYRCCFVTCSR